MTDVPVTRFRETFRTRNIVGTLLALVCLSPGVVAWGSETHLAGRTVSVQLVNANDMSPIPGTTGDVTLIANPPQIVQRTTIYSLLQSNGVLPDGEAFALVYDLNPNLKDINTLPPAGAPLILPKLMVNQGARMKLGTEVLGAVTMDPEIREHLNGQVNELEKAAAQFALLPVRAASVPIRQNVETLAKWFVQIRRSFLHRTGPPIRQSTLVLLSAEADALVGILLPAIGQQRELSPVTEKQIQAIHDDIELEMVKYGQAFSNQAPKGEPVYKVSIHIRGGDPARVDRLRIYYTFGGLFRDPPESPAVPSFAFGHLGSGSSELLPVKNYMVWAAEDGDPGRPVTPPLLIRVSPTKGDSFDFDLSLRPSR